MTVLAHGAQGPFDELILVVPALALLVLAVAGLRRRNLRASEEQGRAEAPAEEQPPS